MKRIYIFLIGLLFLSTSCNIYRYEEHQSRVVNLGGNGVITSTTADLNVSETRISHTETFAHEETENDVDINYAKKYTLSSALIKHNADVLVGILYDVTTNEQNDKVSVTVTGYPATYVNFRNTSSEDSLILSLASGLTDVENTKASMTITEKEKKEEKKRWENSLALTYGLVLEPGIEYTGGMRFDDMFYVGFGVGYNFNLDDYSHYAPLFLQFKTFFLNKKRINPFIGVSQGVGVRLEQYGGCFAIGSHTRGEVGVNFKLNPKTSLFLEYNIGISPYIYSRNRFIDNSYSTYGNYAYQYQAAHRLYQGFKIGITF